MLRLTNTERYQRDYKRYTLAVERIVDDKTRQQAQQLLLQFKTQSNIIDEAHNSRNNGSVDPRNVRDNIQTLVEIRQELERLIQDSR